MRPRTVTTLTLAALWTVSAVVAPAHGATITVDPGGSIQAALDAAVDGDVVTVAPGVYDEDLDFGGKAVTVRGAGPSTIVRGTGARSVVRFAGGEGLDSVLDSVMVTGGRAPQGGGIYVNGASPTIVRTVIAFNQAVGAGSGIYVAASNADILNNLLAYNSHAGGDPHGLEIVNAAPRVLNNTIVRGDSNGIILRGSSPALVMNNVIAWNGSSQGAGDRRGRGICDFSGGTARIHYNLFHRNRVGALLTNGVDFRSVQRAERTIGLPRLTGNLDVAPGFVRRVPPRLESPEAAMGVPSGFWLRTMGRVRAAHAGNPDPAYANRDGSRNTLGVTGGPFAAE